MSALIRVLFIIAVMFSTDLAHGEDVAGLQAQIAALLSNGQRLELPVERLRPALVAHYLGNHAPPYWLASNHMDQFLARVNAAVYDGLNSTDYPISTLQQMKADAQTGDPAAAAHAELYYTAFFVAYATDLKIGRVTPQKVDPNLFRSPKTVDQLRLISEMSHSSNPDQFLTSFESRNPHYQALKKMLKVYTDAINQGINWPVIAPGAVIGPGASDQRIPALRELLALTGDYNGAASNAPNYDTALAQALVHFQSRHGLEAKGLLGKQTVVALNVAPQDRQHQIMLNMERWRWMPENMGDEHFLINIAGYGLEHVLKNTVVDKMDVVVGAVATQTPEFSGAMQYIELNPYWTVPYNIATTEMLSKLKVNPSAYAEDFELFSGGKLADWNSVNWAQYGGSGPFPFTFRQKPGPKNALGKVKFMLPNRFNIYLHDTPAKDKFFKTTRAFSHGCIRLSKPGELAYAMLARTGMDKVAVDAVWASGQNTRVNLPQTVPVHLIYATAFSSDNGIEFRTDVYGRDRKLYAALFGKPAT